jgi:hypothetical protein
MLNSENLEEMRYEVTLSNKLVHEQTTPPSHWHGFLIKGLRFPQYAEKNPESRRSLAGDPAADEWSCWNPVSCLRLLHR